MNFHFDNVFVVDDGSVIGDVGLHLFAEFAGAVFCILMAIRWIILNLNLVTKELIVQVRSRIRFFHSFVNCSVTNFFLLVGSCVIISDPIIKFICDSIIVWYQILTRRAV